MYRLGSVKSVVSGTNIHFPLTVCGDCHLRFQIDTQRKPDNWKIIIPKEYSNQIAFKWFNDVIEE